MLKCASYFPTSHYLDQDEASYPAKKLTIGRNSYPHLNHLTAPLCGAQVLASSLPRSFSFNVLTSQELTRIVLTRLEVIPNIVTYG